MAKRKQLDELDAFAQSGAENALMMVLWKVRHQYPEMAVPITVDDLQAFQKSVEFTKQKPVIAIYRRPAQEARAGLPAVGKRKAIPSAPAQAAGKAVMVMVVEAGTGITDASGLSLSPGNTIRPVESDEREHERARKLRDVKAVKDNARRLASDLIGDASRGMYSDARIQEAAQALVALAGE